MKRLTFLFLVGTMSLASAQSVQYSAEAGFYSFRNFGGGQAERYQLNVITPVNTAYTLGAHARFLPKGPFFGQLGLRVSGHEVGIQYVDVMPQLPDTEEDIAVTYAGNFLNRFDAPVVLGLGGNVGPDVRLEGFGGVTPTLNKYRHTGDYTGRFDWAAQVIDQSLNRFSLGYVYGATVWVKRWGLTLAREGNLTPLNHNVVYKGQEYPFTTGFRTTRISISYRFGKGI